MPGKGWWEWKACLDQVLSTKPVEVVQEADQVLEEHDFYVNDLSELHYVAPVIC